MNQIAKDRIVTLETQIAENIARSKETFNVSKYGIKMIKSALRAYNKRMRAEIADIKSTLQNIKRLQPIPACTVDAYELELPQGYTLQENTEVSWRSVWIYTANKEIRSCN